MKLAKQILTLAGYLVLGVFLSCASNVKQQTTQNNKVSISPNLEQIVEIGKAATVQIGSLSIEGPPATGSGFFIRHDLIVTNIHVVNQRSFDGVTSLAKLVNKSTWFTITGVMASDPIRDLVILKVAKMVGDDEPHILSFGDSDSVKTGENIISIGNPRQGTKYVHGDVSKGTIKRLTPHFFHVKAGNLRGGYSGAAILNVQGEVIGIMSRGDATGSGYAVPSKHLKTLIKNMSTEVKSLEEWREEPLIRYYSAEYAVHRGELASALKGFDTAICLAPDFTDAYINRGNARDMLRDFEGAIKDYDTAIRLGADYAFVYARRAGSKSDLGDHKGAIADYNKAIELKPTDAILATIYINRGSAKSDLGNHKGAIADYNKAIELKPENIILAVTHVNRADAKSDLGDHKGAIEDCNTAIGLTQENVILAEAYNVRGKAKSAQGDNINGIIDYDKAIRLERTHPEFYYNRGIANTNLGHNSVAKTDLKTALKFFEQALNISKSVDEKTTFADMRVKLDIRSDLKTDIEKALRLLE
ncbi:MAG: tetratricopeptide repeat-containing serine protease family protein [Candidatus Poribacteria bacterium]|nr:tetratricopeptide repeat-containing serine protease family protein [Candidatus Poribacteria bacterium]